MLLKANFLRANVGYKKSNNTYIWLEKYFYAFRCPLQSYPAEEEDKKDDVREGCSKVNRLEIKKG